MKTVRLCAFIILLCTFLSLIASVAVIADPGDCGAVTTGKAADVVGSTPGSPTAADLKAGEKTEPLAVKVADAVGQNRVSDQPCMDAYRRFPGYVHAGGVRACRDRLYPR